MGLAWRCDLCRLLLSGRGDDRRRTDRVRRQARPAGHRSHRGRRRTTHHHRNSRLGRYVVCRRRIAGRTQRSPPAFSARCGSPIPSAHDPRGRGRSALLVAGCWIGGLGLGPALGGAAAWIVTYFACMLIFWATKAEGRRAQTSRASEVNSTQWSRTPLVTCPRSGDGCVPSRAHACDPTMGTWESLTPQDSSSGSGAADTGSAGRMTPRRVVVVDDHELLRAGTRRILDASADSRSWARRATVTRRSG